MNIKEAIAKRYSERTYKSKRVSTEELFQVLEAGRLAPSACNFQPWKFVVVSEDTNIERISTAYPREWFKSAPQMIIVCGDHNEGWKRKHSDNKDHTDIDVAIAADHMTLMATELGLATCWVCAFDPKIIREILELPNEVEPIVILTIGYPASAIPEAKNRKPIKEVVFLEKYGRNFLK